MASLSVQAYVAANRTIERTFSLFFYIFLTTIKSDIWNIGSLYKPSCKKLFLLYCCLFKNYKLDTQTEQS